MPTFTHNGATLYYEEHGVGFPILTFAPMGLLSYTELWKHPAAPINPVAEWQDRFRVICMDQRNAPDGRSRAPVTAQDGWDTYTGDHIALLEHLDIERCHLFGQCIGGPFIMNMLKHASQRVVAAAIAQPSGRLGALRPGWNPRFAAWADRLRAEQPDVTVETLDRFYHNLYDAGFAYSVDREFARTVSAPMLIMAGNDEAHPFRVAEELSELVGDCEFIPEWKTGAALESARRRLRSFLEKHTPT